MSLSAVLGRGEPGHLPGEGWEILPVKIGHVTVTCLCDLLSMGSTMKKPGTSCYTGMSYALKMMVPDLEVKHILATQGWEDMSELEVSRPLLNAHPHATTIL